MARLSAGETDCVGAQLIAVHLRAAEIGRQNYRGMEQIEQAAENEDTSYAREVRMHRAEQQGNRFRNNLVAPQVDRSWDEGCGMQAGDASVQELEMCLAPD